MHLLATWLRSLFCAGSSFQGELDQKDIVGRWKMLPKSLSLLEIQGYKEPTTAKHEFVLQDDGTVIFTSAIESVGKTTHIIAAGTWKLTFENEINALEINIPNAEGSIFYSLFLTRKDERILLWNYLGDPDIQEFIEYEKQAS